jgi:pimeloyl-ACP methyl ester carboxylesterase
MASQTGITIVWGDMITMDRPQRVTELEIPVYFFHGVHDYTVSYTLSKSNFNRIKAPVKGFYTFKSSAHSPMFEEPDKMNRILRADVLTASTHWADRGAEATLD